MAGAEWECESCAKQAVVWDLVESLWARAEKSERVNEAHSPTNRGVMLSTKEIKVFVSNIATQRLDDEKMNPN